jgi:pimeloyl-ACP methyl ester carboxylesterase/DNA-binding CsgD family transcriptional regulator
MDAPPIQYARTSDGVNIAHFSLGDGPPVVFASNIYGDAHNYALRAPMQSDFPDELVAAGYCVVLMDLRGMGGSDRSVQDSSLDALVGDVEAVTERLGLRQFALCGFGNGAVTAIAYAVKHPDRVSHLLLFMPWRSWRERLAAAATTQAISAMTPKSEEEWEIWAKVVAAVATGFGDSEETRQMAASVQQACTPEQRTIYMRAIQQIDISELLPLVQIPTLVLHVPGAPFSTLGLTKDVAMRIRDAKFAVVNHPHTLKTVFAFLRGRSAGPADEAGAEALSPREVEVLRLVVAGRSNQQIADELVISLNTVRRHVSNVFDKTGARNRAQAAAFAKDHGIA